jgi:hypothetical protein
MLRGVLFKHDASFGACIVPHPQDTFLRVVIGHPTSAKECLLAALRDIRCTLESYENTILSHQAIAELNALPEAFGDTMHEADASSLPPKIAPPSSPHRKTFDL